MAWKAKEESGEEESAEFKSSGTHTHTSRWESDAQETTTDTRMCDVEYTKRQELEGVGRRWFDARHAVGTRDALGKVTSVPVNQDCRPRRRVGGTFSQTHRHVSDGYPT